MLINVSKDDGKEKSDEDPKDKRLEFPVSFYDRDDSSGQSQKKYWTGAQDIFGKGNHHRVRAVKDNKGGPREVFGNNQKVEKRREGKNYKQ